MVTPINRIPPEILSLIPDFWYACERDQNLIALTHVCRTWREVFISRPSLWTNLDCEDEEKACVYLKRSKTSPINLSLYRADRLFPHDPFFDIIPQASDRLVSLIIEGAPENIQDITSRLCRPSPLLEELTIASMKKRGLRNPVIAPVLLNGDLSSLRELSLESVRTELPWRNMINLTSFTLIYPSPGEISVRQFLDFFESAPRLRNVDLYSVILTPSDQNRRLVTLACLKEMEIRDCGPSSALLDHLLIPVGAVLITRADLVTSLIGDLLPRSLDNLRNFSNFTAIKLSVDESKPCMEFSGPNGRVRITPTNSRADGTRLVLGSLAQFDTSKTEKLVIEKGNLQSGDPLYRALLPMKDLCALTLSKCKSLYIFIHALRPSTSSSKIMACPKLEELVLIFHPDSKAVGIKNVIGMAAARASRGKKLRAIRIVDSRDEIDPGDVLELKKHVLRVEHCPGIVGSTVNNDEED